MGYSKNSYLFGKSPGICICLVIEKFSIVSGYNLDFLISLNFEINMKNFVFNFKLLVKH